MAAFPPKTKPKNFLVLVEDEAPTPAFELATDHLNKWITVSIQNSEPVWSYLPFLSSTKTGRFKAKIKYTLGYKVESTEESESDYNIQMSDLQILSYSIDEIKILDKSSGFFNRW